MLIHPLREIPCHGWKQLKYFSLFCVKRHKLNSRTYGCTAREETQIQDHRVSTHDTPDYPVRLFARVAPLLSPTSKIKSQLCDFQRVYFMCGPRVVGWSSTLFSSSQLSLI